MSGKLRHFGIKVMSYWFIIFAFVFQLLIFCFLKETACQNFHLKILLYVGQYTDMSEKCRFFGIEMTSYQFIIVTFVFQFLIFDPLKETAYQNLHLKISLYIGQNTDMSEKWRYFGIEITSDQFIIVTIVFQFLIFDFLKGTAC